MATPTPDPLATLADVKTMLGISGPSQDTLLNLLITQVSALITESCNRTHFLSSNVACPITEYYSGEGNEWLVLNQWPVPTTGITAVYEDTDGLWGQAPNAFAAATQLTQGVDYALRVDQPGNVSRSAMLLRIRGVWQSQYWKDGLALATYPHTGLGNIRVDYSPGFATIPSDLALAAIRVISKVRGSRKWGMLVQGGGYEEFHINFASWPEVKLGLLDGDTAPAIARYRICPVGVA